MPKQSRKPKLPDPNLTAISIVEAVTGETLVERPAPPRPTTAKTPPRSPWAARADLKAARLGPRA